LQRPGAVLQAAVSCALWLVAAAPGMTDEPVPEERPGSFHWQRAARDLGAVMGLGVAWYVSQFEVNKLDFDFDRTFSDQARRLTGDGFRFDDNDRFLNVGHSFTGSYYHLLARVHGAAMWQAMLFDLTASTAWELTVEHREVVSLNDTVTTSVGGVALGEAMFRMGDFFARSRPTLASRLLMGVLSPARALTWLYGDTPRPSLAGFDENGLADDAHHRFALALGGASIPDLGWRSAALLDLELIDLPSYGRAATASRSLSGGEMTRLAVAFTGNQDDMQSLTIQARSSLWGRYRQDTGDDASLAGHASFLGSSTAFELAFREMGEVTDFLMAVHVLGPSADVTLHRSDWRVRMAADLYPDFAMVRPFALDDEADRPMEVPGQSTLHHDYYYAAGVTAAARVEASCRRARAGASAEWSGYDAIEGLDRHQRAYTSPTGIHHEAIRDDRDMTDQRLTLRLFTEIPVPFTDLALGGGADYLRRDGSATGASREHDELRFTLQAIYSL